MQIKKYSFEEIVKCEACFDHNVANHKILGLRLNQSQGLKPKEKLGIAVTIIKCTNCGLIYSNPMPIPNHLTDHYGIDPETYSWGADYIKYDDSYFLKQVNQAKELITIKNNLTALDIGAGLGKAMKSMENGGFEAYGIEPSPNFRNKAIEWLKIKENRLQLASAEEAEFEPNKFDFITFGAVFEHLYHPDFIINKVNPWLKPGGIIHIEVPSTNWLIPKLVNFYYKYIKRTSFVSNLSPMHAPFHLYEYSLNSFEEIAKRNNLKVVKHYFDVCTIYYVPNFLKPLFRFIMEKTNSGMQLTVYLKKM